MPLKYDPRYKDPYYYEKYYAANREKILAKARGRAKLRALNPEVKRARRIHSYTKLYGLSMEQYNEILMKQNNACAICGKPHSEEHRKKLCVDHCHESGKIRGLLCYECNFALGKFKDNVILLKAAVAYLEKQS